MTRPKNTETAHEDHRKNKMDEIHPRLRKSAQKIQSTDFTADHSFFEDGLRVGPEDEFFIFSGGAPVQSERRNTIKEEAEVDAELGSYMLESSPGPKMIGGLGELETFLRQSEEPILDSLEDDEFLSRYGILPSSLSNIELTEEERYRSLIETYRQKQGSIPEELGRIGDEYETVNPKNVEVPAAISAHQLNVQAPSKEEAMEWANHIYAVQPYVLAASGHSRVVEGKDTGLAEPGKYMWPLNFNLQDGEVNNVGKWQSFREDALDDLSRVEAVTEFDLKEDEDELEMAKKQDWKYVKAKYEMTESGEGQIILEWRALPQQPSVEENVAMDGMMLGLLAYNLREGPAVDEISIEDVNYNYDSAMLHGKDHKMYTLEGELRDTEEVFREYTDRAEKGLEMIGFEDGEEYMDIMRERLEYPEGLEPEEQTYRGTPSERVAERMNNTPEEMSPEQALLESAPKEELNQ